MSVMEAVVRNHEGFLSSCFLSPAEALPKAEAPGQIQGQDPGFPPGLSSHGATKSVGVGVRCLGPLGDHGQSRQLHGVWVDAHLLNDDATVTHLEVSQG